MKTIFGTCDKIQGEGDKLYARIKGIVKPELEEKDYVSMLDYMGYARQKELEGQTVTDYILPIQMALNANLSVYIPKMDTPVYISEGITLNSGNTLKVHPETRIVFMADGVMLHNRNVMDGHYNYVEPGNHSDRDVAVIGGIWEAPKTKIIGERQAEGYLGYLGCDSLFLLHNVINVRMEHLKIAHTKRMGVMIGNCENFMVQDIEFEDAARDGIHVEGPCWNGIIRDLRGKVGDDLVALNAWDWTNAALTFGAIHDVIVEDVWTEPGYLWSEMRLHPGNYTLPTGRVIQCPVYNIVFKNVHGIHTVKFYNQPNLMPGYNFDKSFGLGEINNVYFDNVTFDYYPLNQYYTQKDACIEVHADCFNLNFKNIKINYPLADKDHDNYRFIAVGPISATWKINDNPDDWFDFFDPDSNCHVDRITLENITVNGEACKDEDKLLYVRHQTVNPDYPNTTPAGGTGFGVVKEIYID